MGYKLFSTGEVLTANNVNSYLMKQTVMVFADSTARTTALSGVLAQGMISYITSTNTLENYNGSAWVVIGDVSLTGTQTLTNKTLSTPREIITISATAATGTVNFDAITQAVLYYTSSASANWILNVRGNSGTTLDSILATNSSMTVTHLVSQGATPYYPTSFKIDGTTITPKWLGGTAPTAGNANSVDAYSYVIVKTGSAAFTILASQTRFA